MMWIASLSVPGGGSSAQWQITLIFFMQAQAKAVEPDLQCLGALHLPSTGMVDSHGFMLSLLGDLEHGDGTFVLNSALALVEYARPAINVIARDGMHISAQSIVNAAGLGALEMGGRARFDIESPGLTSSLAIGERVVQMLQSA